MKKIKELYSNTLIFFNGMSKKMKMIIIGALATIVILAVIFTGFSSNSNGMKVIPINTAGVAIIDLGSLYDKADIDKLMELDLIEKGMKSAGDFIPEGPFSDIINDPSESGIDLKSEIYIFSSLNLKNQFLCGSIGLEDGDKFNEFMEDLEKEFKKMGYDKIKENDDEGYKYIISEGRDGFGLAWDNEALLAITSPENRVNEKTIKKELERLMTLDSDEQITYNDNFNDFYSKKTDICIWASTDFAREYIPSIAIKQGLKVAKKTLKNYDIEIDIDLDDEDDIDEIFENSVQFFFNFGEGNISIKSGIYLNDIIQEIVEEITEIDPTELSIEIILTFDDSGRNSLNAILMTAYNIAEKAGKNAMRAIELFSTSEHPNANKLISNY